MLTSAARETLARRSRRSSSTRCTPSPAPSAARTSPCRSSGSTAVDTPAQRIGLSATVRPPEEVARFLAGAAPTTIVLRRSGKTFDLRSRCPSGHDRARNGSTRVGANLVENSIWPDVEERIVDLIESHNSTIVFTNSRRLAERLTARLNEIHAERTSVALGAEPNPKVGGGAPAYNMGSGISLRRRGHPRQGASRLGQQGAARPRRRGSQERPAQGRRRDVEPRARHRHGCGRPRHPGRVAAVGGQRPAAHRPRRPPGRRDLAGACCSPSTAPISSTARSPSSACWPARSRPCRCRPTRSTCWRSTPSPQPLSSRWTPTSGSTPSDAAHRSRRCPRSAFEATLDLLSGKYPSTEFAELRPRLVYDRDARHADRPARRTATRRHLAAAPSPTAACSRVYLASARNREAFARRRTRRGNGLRVRAGRRHRPRSDQLAHHRDHPRPGARRARARPARPVAVLAWRRGRTARRAGRRHRRVYGQLVGHGPRGVR